MHGCLLQLWISFSRYPWPRVSPSLIRVPCLVLGELAWRPQGKDRGWRTRGRAGLAPSRHDASLHSREPRRWDKRLAPPGSPLGGADRPGVTPGQSSWFANRARGEARGWEHRWEVKGHLANEWWLKCLQRRGLGLSNRFGGDSEVQVWEEASPTPSVSAPPPCKLHSHQTSKCGIEQIF